MAWSAENATRAYLHTLKTGNNSSEPNVAEFISAMAAGNGARLMVEICATTAGATTLALVAAARQTGGQVACIVPDNHHLHASHAILGEEASWVHLVVGDPQTLLVRDFNNANFVLLDCAMRGHERTFTVAEAVVGRSGGGVVVGHNAMRCEVSSAVRSELLPIGDGLRVGRVAARKKSQWVVRVDECTGEEHVFRVGGPTRRGQVEA